MACAWPSSLIFCQPEVSHTASPVACVVGDPGEVHAVAVIQSGVCVKPAAKSLAERAAVGAVDAGVPVPVGVAWLGDVGSRSPVVGQRLPDGGQVQVVPHADIPAVMKPVFAAAFCDIGLK